MAREHHFDQSSQFEHGYTNLSCQTPQLQPIAQAFIRNMNRVRGMGMLPINLTCIAIINEAARVEALANKKISFHDPRITLGNQNFDSVLFGEVDKERQRLVASWMASWGSGFNQRFFTTGVYAMNLIIDA